MPPAASGPSGSGGFLRFRAGGDGRLRARVKRAETAFASGWVRGAFLILAGLTAEGAARVGCPLACPLPNPVPLVCPR